MSVNHIDYFDARLMVGIKPADTVLTLQPMRGLLEKLNALPIGDHIYIHLRVGATVEVVKYTHVAELPKQQKIVLPVERGQHGTVISSFPYGSCVGTRLTKHFLDEWWAEKQNAM